MKKAYIDLTICKCPNCGNFFIEPSWFVFELEQDFECGVCKQIFNTKKTVIKKFLFEFELDNKGNIKRVEQSKSRY